MTVLGDASGGYLMTLPLHATNTNYAAMFLRLFDPVSDLTLSRFGINLSGLQAGVRWLLPTISGLCFDFDDLFPDDDDPDCD